MSRATPKPTDLTDQQLAMLARLAEIGMEIAEEAGRQARGLGQGPAPDPALSFARAARAVRLTIALQARLVADRTASGREAAAARASEATRRRDRIHVKIERAVEQLAEAGSVDADAVEHLSSAAWERLTEADDADLLDRPIEEIVVQICADLGLSAGWAAQSFNADLPSLWPMGDGSKVGVFAPSSGRKAQPPPSPCRKPSGLALAPTGPPSANGKGPAAVRQDIPAASGP